MEPYGATLHITIFAHGHPCPPALAKRLRKGRFTIALDGAAEQARREGWKPNLITGDFDGATKATLRHFEKKGTQILPTPDQDHNDLEKALAWCALQKADSIWIAQSQGGRLDHSFAALGFLKRFHKPGRELLLFQAGEKIRFARDEKLQLHGKAGRRIAVLPFPACRVKSKGLAFEMDFLLLELGVKESISNQARIQQPSLMIQGEALVVEGL